MSSSVNHRDIAAPIVGTQSAFGINCDIEGSPHRYSGCNSIAAGVDHGNAIIVIVYHIDTSTFGISARPRGLLYAISDSTL
jgi:hypothetical protein